MTDRELADMYARQVEQVTRERDEAREKLLSAEVDRDLNQSMVSYITGELTKLRESSKRRTASCTDKGWETTAGQHEAVEMAVGELLDRVELKIEEVL